LDGKTGCGCEFVYADAGQGAGCTKLGSCDHVH
jgi:hypothetical protein